MADTIKNIKIIISTPTTIYPDSIQSFSLLESFCSSGAYMPGLVANRTINVTFMPNEYQKSEAFFRNIVGSKISVYNAEDGTIIGKYYIYNFSQDTETLMSFVAYSMNPNGYKDDIFIPNSTKTAKEWLEYYFNVDDSIDDILPDSVTTDISSVKPPVNLNLYPYSSTEDRETTYSEILKNIGLWTGLSFVYDGGFSYTSPVVKALYPKRKNIIISASASDYYVDDDGNYVFPMFDNDRKYSRLPCYYPYLVTLCCLSNGGYDESWQLGDDDRGYGIRNIRVENGNGLYVMANTSSTDYHSASRAFYNLVNLMYGEITNIGFVPSTSAIPKGVSSDTMEKYCIYPFSFRTVNTTKISIGDIITVKPGIDATSEYAYECIVTSVSISLNGTTVECSASDVSV